LTHRTLLASATEILFNSALRYQPIASTWLKQIFDSLEKKAEADWSTVEQALPPPLDALSALKLCIEATGESQSLFRIIDVSAKNLCCLSLSYRKTLHQAEGSLHRFFKGDAKMDRLTNLPTVLVLGFDYSRGIRPIEFPDGMQLDCVAKDPPPDRWSFNPTRNGVHKYKLRSVICREGTRFRALLDINFDWTERSRRDLGVVALLYEKS